MTSPEGSLPPASGDDRRALLGARELVARGGVQLAEVVGTVVGQCVALEPGPQIFHRIEVGRIRRQEGNLDMPIQAVQILPNQADCDAL